MRIQGDLCTSHSGLCDPSLHREGMNFWVLVALRVALCAAFAAPGLWGIEMDTQCVSKRRYLDRVWREPLADLRICVARAVASADFDELDTFLHVESGGGPSSARLQVTLTVRRRQLLRAVRPLGRMCLLRRCRPGTSKDN